MADICSTCKHWNKLSALIELANGNFIEQQGFVTVTGGDIAKCTNPLTSWGDIVRDISTADFFNNAEKQSVFEHSNSIGSGENDTCPFYEPVEVTSIVVTSDSGIETVDIGGNLAMVATVLPINAVDASVTWSVIAGTGTASIDISGVVTGLTEGTVTVRATANDGSGVYGELEINVYVYVASIAVTGFGGATTVVNGGTLQMLAAILPITASVQTVTWSVTNDTGIATITQLGVLTGGSLGDVFVRATAQDGSGIFDEITITVI